jgi:hypothetical protein
MPSALYLYNARDTASISFFTQVEACLARAGWSLKADYKGALAGHDGEAMTIVTSLMREVDAIVYAIGPKGPGWTQAVTEAEACMQARVEAKTKGRELKVVPVLIRGDDFGMVPTVLRGLSVQADNTAKGGDDALTNLLRALLGDRADQALSGSGSPSVRITAEQQISRILDRIARSRHNGLALFISPYAVSEVHEDMGPGDIGHALLKEKIPDLEVDDLLAHPFVAAGARALLEGSFQDTWAMMQNTFAKLAQTPMPLHDRIAGLAKVWPDPRAASGENNPRFKGLLLVTTDLDMRLEQALWMADVDFARLRFTLPDEDDETAGDPTLRPVYERPVPRTTSQTLKFVRVRGGEPGSVDVESSIRGRGYQGYEPVMVVKLLDCISNDTYPPLSTIHVLKAIRDARLPAPMTGLLQRAPFIMLGGGLLHPLVSFALATHFLPNFSRRLASTDPVPRYVAMHSAPGPGDKLRRLERRADGEDLNWTRDIFELDRLTCDLLYLLRQLADRVAVGEHVP